MVKTICACLFALLVVLVSSYGPQYVDDTQSAFDVDPSSIALALCYFALMLLGAFASERYKFFSANALAGGNFLKQISYAYLYRSLLVSPIIFGAVVTYIGRDANVVMAAIFSFQNGFFWETIFSAQAVKLAESSR
jgi:hypothetical protein